MQIIKVIFFIIGAGLSACSFGLHKTLNTTLIPVNNEHTTNNVIDSIVFPYKGNLEKEMNEKIAFAQVDFINERINGNLGNMVSDILLGESEKTTPKNAICLLNFGGLRSSINKGDITLGDAYKLLPFDNYLVLVKMKAEAQNEFLNWILKTQGHPIAGFYIHKGKLLDKNKNDFPKEDFWVLTSDYLLNGGDNAYFFKNNTEVIQTNLLLRDVFINGIKGKILENNKEERIIL